MSILSNLSEQQQQQFASQYEASRKNPDTMLVISLFLGGFGVDRFLLGNIGLGILKLLTLGGFGILAAIDWFLIRKATYVYNQKQAGTILAPMAGTIREFATPPLPAVQAYDRQTFGGMATWHKVAIGAWAVYALAIFALLASGDGAHQNVVANTPSPSAQPQARPQPAPAPASSSNSSNQSDSEGGALQKVFNAVLDAEEKPIHKKVISDEIDQYNMAVRSGDKMEMCVHAGVVSASLMQAKDEDNWTKWKAIEKKACRAAGVPQL